MTALLVSGLVTEGGLYRVADGEVERLDDVASTGLLLAESGLYRARFSRTQIKVDHIIGGQTAATFTPDGAQPHGLALDAGQLAVVDTLGNRVVWLDPNSGAVERSWCPSSVPDSWHLNSLSWYQGTLAVSCFGRFDVAEGGDKKVGTYGWWGAGPRCVGEIIDIATGERVLGGLSAPHSPTRVGESWLLCESYIGELVRHYDDGRTERLVLGGWPRGLYVDGDSAWVGVSDSERTPQEPPPHGRSPGKLVRVDLGTFSVVEEVAMPCSGIYDVIVAG